LVEHEKAARLDDILLRRTLLAMLGCLTKESVREMGEVFGDCMGWDAKQKSAEAERVTTLLCGTHGAKL
jgi:glycerol-3-phosphate dehydrogenase